MLFTFPDISHVIPIVDPLRFEGQSKSVGNGGAWLQLVPSPSQPKSNRTLLIAFNCWLSINKACEHFVRKKTKKNKIIALCKKLWPQTLEVMSVFNNFVALILLCLCVTSLAQTTYVLDNANSSAFVVIGSAWNTWWKDFAPHGQWSSMYNDLEFADNARATVDILLRLPSGANAGSSMMQRKISLGRFFFFNVFFLS